jgi:cell division protein FtsB
VGTLARRWWPILALLLILGALQAKLWLGAGGWPEAKSLQRTVRTQRTENLRLQQRNDALSAEVEDLKSGETAVEERARSELGMIKPGETFYRVVEPHPPGDAATVADDAEPAKDADDAEAPKDSNDTVPAKAAEPMKDGGDAEPVQ